MPMDPSMMGQQPPMPAMSEGVSQEAMPQNPGMGASQEPDRTEEFRANLDQMMDKLKEKYGQFNAMKFQSENKMQVMQEDTIKQLMELLQENGVDPADENSINDFLETIKEQDEDLYLLMEKFIDIILNGIGNTPSDNDISGEQVSELAGKMGEGSSATVPGQMQQMEPIDTSVASQQQPAAPEEMPTSGPGQFQNLSKHPMTPPVI